MFFTKFVVTDVAREYLRVSLLHTFIAEIWGFTAYAELETLAAITNCLITGVTRVEPNIHGHMHIPARFCTSVTEAYVTNITCAFEIVW